MGVDKVEEVFLAKALDAVLCSPNMTLLSLFKLGDGAWLVRSDRLGQMKLKLSHLGLPRNVVPNPCQIVHCSFFNL